ncbi:hypothetical protein RAS1_14390 [Phycisphaerae bacterium RAS1]|nr:hypothetical protein RAS1_14390 [Phycisphaerae bacterium RAS1]
MPITIEKPVFDALLSVVTAEHAAAEQRMTLMETILNGARSAKQVDFEERPAPQPTPPAGQPKPKPGAAPATGKARRDKR